MKNNKISTYSIVIPQCVPACTENELPINGDPGDQELGWGWATIWLGKWDSYYKEVQRMFVYKKNYRNRIDICKTATETI